MVRCEVCGQTAGKIFGSSNKFGKALCNKHYIQMRRYGSISERTIYDKNEIVICDDYSKIVLYDKQSNITSFALIDTEDIDKVKDIKWCMGINGYVVGKIKRNTVYLHHLITGEISHELVRDHINRNKADNRKENIRICTKQENSFNQIKLKDTLSGYLGVHWRKDTEKWSASIQVSGKQIYLGCSKDKSDVIKYRSDGESKHFSVSR